MGFKIRDLFSRWVQATPKLFVAIALFAFAVPALGQDAAREPRLRRELLDRSKRDQDARYRLLNWMNKHRSNGKAVDENLSVGQNAEYQKLLAAGANTDKENTGWLKDVIEKYGWPTNSMVGHDGAEAAWLLVQHADADTKFQRKCLDLMAQLPSTEVSPMDRAYLTDRVLLAEGKKQVYGTQFERVDGKLQPRALDDEANVDTRRAEVGLPPIGEYAKGLTKAYGAGAKDMK